MKKVKLGEVAINIDNRRKPLNNLQRSEKSFSKKYPYCGANNIIDYIDEYIFDESEEILCIAEDGGNWGKEEECTYVMNEKCWVNNHAHVLKMKTGVDINYIKLTLDYLDLTSYITGSTRGKLTKSSLDKIEINLPNYHTQISISKKISDIQKLITKKEAQIQKYNELVKSRFNEMFGDPISNSLKLPIKKFEKVVTLQRGFDLPIQNRQVGEINVWGSNGIVATHTESKVTEQGIVTGRSGSIGKVYVTEKEYWPLNTTLFSKELHGNNPIFLKYLLEAFKLERFNNGTGVPTLNRNIVHKEDIIYVPLSLQNEFADFVAQVDKSQLAIQKSLDELETLKKSLMQKYFG